MPTNQDENTSKKPPARTRSPRRIRRPGMDDSSGNQSPVRTGSTRRAGMVRANTASAGTTDRGQSPTRTGSVRRPGFVKGGGWSRSAATSASSLEAKEESGEREGSVVRRAGFVRSSQGAARSNVATSTRGQDIPNRSGHGSSDDDNNKNRGSYFRRKGAARSNMENPDAARRSNSGHIPAHAMSSGHSSRPFAVDLLEDDSPNTTPAARSMTQGNMPRHSSRPNTSGLEDDDSDENFPSRRTATLGSLPMHTSATLNTDEDDDDTMPRVPPAHRSNSGLSAGGIDQGDTDFEISGISSYGRARGSPNTSFRFTSTSAPASDHLRRNANSFLPGEDPLGDYSHNDNNQRNHDMISNLTRFDRFDKNSTSTNGARNSQGQSTETIGNAFMARRDLREVDQSVNLMAGQFNESIGDFNARPSRSRKGRKPRASVVDIFFGDPGDTTKVNRKSMIDIDLGVGPSKGRKSMFGAALGPGSGGLKAPLWYRMEECCDCLWESFKSVFCNLMFWMVVLATAACALAIYFILKIDWNNIDVLPPASSSVPTPSQAPALSSLVEVPANDGIPTILDDEPVDAAERRDAIRSVIMELGVSRTEDLEDPDSAPSKAISWLAEFDPALMNLASTPQTVLIERFVLASVYFLSNEEISPSNAGAVPVSGQRLLRGLESSSLLSFSGWMSAKSVCQWHGIYCQDEIGPVIEVNLTKAGLSSPLPVELSALDDLLELDLSHNMFQGTIPPEWGSAWKKVRYLLLNSNALTGTIPDSLGEMVSLYDLDLSSNSLSGNLPLSLLQLRELRLLFLDSNDFDGSIPPNVGALGNIEYLDLSNNKFEGELPIQVFSKMKHLVDLRLNNNDLTGTIPPEIESLHRLESLRLGKNKLHGELPNDLERLHYLEDLDLHDNFFTGALPASLGHLTLLKRLNLSHNNLTGGLPLEMAKMTALESLLLAHNSMSGSISGEVCALKTSYNLQQLQADCSEKIQCSCCDKCF